MIVFLWDDISAPYTFVFNINFDNNSLSCKQLEYCLITSLDLVQKFEILVRKVVNFSVNFNQKIINIVVKRWVSSEQYHCKEIAEYNKLITNFETGDSLSFRPVYFLYKVAPYNSQDIRINNTDKHNTL